MAPRMGRAPGGIRGADEESEIRARLSRALRLDGGGSGFMPVPPLTASERIAAAHPDLAAATAIVTRVATDAVVARTAIDDVVAVPAAQIVVAIVAADHVVAAGAVDGVAAAESDDDVA